MTAVLVFKRDDSNPADTACAVYRVGAPNALRWHMPRADMLDAVGVLWRLGTQRGAWYYVDELIEGRTVRSPRKACYERLKRAAWSIDEACPQLAAVLADSLEAETFGDRVRARLRPVRSGFAIDAH